MKITNKNLLGYLPGGTDYEGHKKSFNGGKSRNRLHYYPDSFQNNI